MWYLSAIPTVLSDLFTSQPPICLLFEPPDQFLSYNNNNNNIILSPLEELDPRDLIVCPTSNTKELKTDDSFDQLLQEYQSKCMCLLMPSNDISQITLAAAEWITFTDSWFQQHQKGTMLYIFIRRNNLDCGFLFMLTCIYRWHLIHHTIEQQQHPYSTGHDSNTPNEHMIYQQVISWLQTLLASFTQDRYEYSPTNQYQWYLIRPQVLTMNTVNTAVDYDFTTVIEDQQSTKVQDDNTNEEASITRTSNVSSNSHLSEFSVGSDTIVADDTESHSVFTCFNRKRKHDLAR